jgi:hypothetical protein
MGTGTVVKSKVKLSVSDTDPKSTFHFDGDPDPTFQFDADPDPTFHFDADPDPTFQYDAYLVQWSDLFLIF